MRISREQRDEKERFILDEIKAENIQKEYVNQARHKTQYVVGTGQALHYKNEHDVYKAATFVEDQNRNGNKRGFKRKMKAFFKGVFTKNEQ